MYAIYCYQAGATQANVVSDVIALLTGTTNPASLSASCVVASTSIISTTPAGWTLYDAAAGAAFKIVTALCQDGVTSKYWGINFSSVTAYSCAIAETWNATTHVGTNTCSSSAGVWSSAAGGFFYIYASRKEITILSWTAGGGYQGVCGSCFEFTRDTIPAGYPCYGMCMTVGGSMPQIVGISTTNSWMMPRFKNPTSAGDTTGGASTVSKTNIGVIQNTGGTTVAGLGLYRDAAENIYMALYSIGMTLAGVHAGVSVGSVRLSVLNAAAAPLDEVSYSGSTYVGLGTTGTTTFWVPKL